MQKSILQTIKFLLLPAIITLGAIVAAMNLDGLPESFSGILILLPYMAIIFGLGISYKFNRVKEVFYFLHMGIAYFLFSRYFSLESEVEPIVAETVFHAVTVFVPLNILILSFLKERPFFTPDGIIRFFVMILQGLFTFWIIFIESYYTVGLLNIKHFNVMQLFTVSELSFFTSIAALVVMGVKTFRARNYEQMGAFAALFPLFLAFLAVDTYGAFSLLITASALSLIVGTVFNSFNLAYVDELTGILGRRAMREKMASLTGTYTIAMMDIDHFKNFNDTYGHDVGDDVLRMVANQIAAVTGGGRAYRFGGEEFTVVFPNKTIRQTLKHLEQVRVNVQDYQFSIRNKVERPNSGQDGTKKRKIPPRSSTMVSVAISIGVAEKDTEHIEPEDVLKGADKALYRAKNNGRNQLSH
ncbi:MAG: GGDEF domain-containing protein [Fibrobacterales bacterium]